MNIAPDRPFIRLSTGLFLGHSDPLLAQVELGLGHIAVGLDEGLLAVHEADAASLAQLFHHLCGDFRHRAKFRYCFA